MHGRSIASLQHHLCSSICRIRREDVAALILCAYYSLMEWLSGGDASACAGGLELIKINMNVGEQLRVGWQ